MGKRWLALAVLVVAAVATTVAYADTVSGDGDIVVQNNRLQYGPGGFQEPCSGRGVPVAGAVTVTFNGTRHFDSGSMLTVTATPNSFAAAVGITASGSTAVVPTPWDTPRQTFTIPITTTVPVSAPDGSYLKKQIISLCLGLAIALAIMFTDYRKIVMIIAPFFYAATSLTVGFTGTLDAVTKTGNLTIIRQSLKTIVVTPTTVAAGESSTS